MAHIIYFHFRWIHDYQDACVDKIEDFMNDVRSSTLEQIQHHPSHQNPATPPVLRKTGSVDSQSPVTHRPISSFLGRLGQSVDSLT